MRDVFHTRCCRTMKLRLLWLALLTFGLTGCALDVHETSSPAVGGWMDLTPETVVEIRTPMPEVRLGFYAPKAPDEAAERGRRFAAGAAVATRSGWGLAAAPVVVPLGALFGSIQGMSDVELARCRHSLTSQVAELRFIHDLADSLIRCGKEHTRIHWRSGTDSTPAAGTHPIIINVYPAYFALTPSWANRDALNPPLEFLAEVNCEIYSAADPQHWVVERFDYHGPARSLRTWAAEPGLLTREAAVCTEQLTKRIVADLFEANLESRAARRGRSKGGL